MKNISRGYIFNALRKALRIKRRKKTWKGDLEEKSHT